MANLSAELNRDVLAEVRRFYKAELGRYDIREFYRDNKFDKNVFGEQCKCGFCHTTFNPFFVESLTVKSEWTWQTDGPEKKFSLNCPNCNEELRLMIFLSQE